MIISIVQSKYCKNAIHKLQFPPIYLQIIKYLVTNCKIFNLDIFKNNKKTPI